MRRLAALALLLLGCNNTGELLVLFDSNIAPAQYGELDVHIDEPHDTFDSSYLLPSDTTLPASLSVRARSGEPQITIDATLYAADLTTLLVERKAELSIVHAQSLELVLRLDASCVDVSCDNAGETCIDGACVSDHVDDSTLPHTSGNGAGDLAPHDGGVELDLAMQPSDLSSDLAPTQDLLPVADLLPPPPDLAPYPIPPPPAATAGCTLYDFTTVNYAMYALTIAMQGGVTIEQPAGQPYVHISMSMTGSGNWVTPYDDANKNLFLITPSTAARNDDWIMRVGYLMTTHGAGFVGIHAEGTDANGTSLVPAAWFEAGTTEPATSGGDRLFSRTPADSNQAEPTDRNDTNLSGGIVVQVSQQVTPSTAAAFTYDIGGVASQNPISPPGISSWSVPSFFVGNELDPTIGPDNSVDVQLGWIQLCQ